MIPNDACLEPPEPETTEAQWIEIERRALESDLSDDALGRHQCYVRCVGLVPALNYLRARRAAS